MEYIKGYNFDVFKTKRVNIDDFKEHISDYKINIFALDGYFSLSGGRVGLLADNDAPVTYSECIFYPNSICINTEYYIENKSTIDELIKLVIKNKTGKLTIIDTLLINEEVINEIANNPNIEEVTLGCRSDVYSIDKNTYEKLKNSGIKTIRTYGVSDELRDVFEPQLEFNYMRSLIDSYNYEFLVKAESFYINKDLSEEEIINLKYLNKEAKISINKVSVMNIFQILKRLNELGKTTQIEITLEDKNEFNNYLFNHLDDVKSFMEVQINFDYLKYDLLTYIKNEKRLIDMIAKAVNLSPFERYLYVYSVAKKFKKYKENHEDKMSSRSLYELLDNEYMVCVGYSKLLGDLSSKLGIETDDLSVSVDIGLDAVKSGEFVLPDFIENRDGEKKEVLTERGGHARRHVHIVDSKYGIDGYFIADPTWDNDMEHDTFNYALMTYDEYITTDRYNYMDVYGIEELLFSHSLDEFYNKINFLLDKGNVESEEDIVIKFLYHFKSVDKRFYEKLITKYAIEHDFNPKLSSEQISDIFLDIGENILNKANNNISGKTYQDAITVLYRDVYGYSDEELDKKVSEVMEYNKRKQAYCFPKRYKINSDGSREVLFETVNKFDVEEGLSLAS